MRSPLADVHIPTDHGLAHVLVEQAKTFGSRTALVSAYLVTFIYTRMHTHTHTGTYELIHTHMYILTQKHAHLDKYKIQTAMHADRYRYT